MANKIKITLKRSTIGCPEKQRATVRGLGLTRLNKTVILDNTPTIRGMIKKVIHLVRVDEEFVES